MSVKRLLPKSKLEDYVRTMNCKLRFFSCHFYCRPFKRDHRGSHRHHLPPIQRQAQTRLLLVRLNLKGQVRTFSSNTLYKRYRVYIFGGSFITIKFPLTAVVKRKNALKILIKQVRRQINVSYRFNSMVASVYLMSSSSPAFYLLQECVYNKAPEVELSSYILILQNIFILLMNSKLLSIGGSLTFLFNFSFKF